MNWCNQYWTIIWINWYWISIFPCQNWTDQENCRIYRTEPIVIAVRSPIAQSSKCGCRAYHMQIWTMYVNVYHVQECTSHTWICTLHENLHYPCESTLHMQKYTMCENAYYMCKGISWGRMHNIIYKSCYLTVISIWAPRSAITTLHITYHMSHDQ